MEQVKKSIQLRSMVDRIERINTSSTPQGKIQDGSLTRREIRTIQKSQYFSPRSKGGASLIEYMKNEVNMS